MGSLDTAVPALLFRLDRNPFHHGSLGAARSLGRAGVPVHAFTESVHGPLASSRHVRRVYPMPPSGSPPSLDAIERVLGRVAGRIGRPAVLIPMDDAAAVAADLLAEELTDRFLLPGGGGVTGLPERLADKAELVGLCRELNLPHPDTYAPATEEEVRAVVAELGLPVIAKWSRPALLPTGSGLRSTTLVHSRDELLGLIDRTGEAGSRLLVQRVLPGGPGADWFFHGCFGEGGRLLMGGTGRKELAWPPRAGLTAVGSWLPHPAIERAATRLAARIGYRGVLDLDFRRDPETGDHHLLDANPRPGAQFRLFTDRTGLDVVRALHLMATGRPVPRAVPVPGRLFVTENYGLLSALAGPPRRGSGSRAGAAPAACPGGAPLRLRAGGPSCRVETAWFAPDDPVPFVAMTAGWLRRAAEKGLRPLRERMAAGAAARADEAARAAAEAAPTGTAPVTGVGAAGMSRPARPSRREAPGRAAVRALRPVRDHFSA
ncbi:hypothetical protein GCM10027160_34960 [Streptomyces calidiresistens]|uniref:carboxylate--amine ligase n=1 Tax=Streptomyces calidiresistens TaxID=1485586 RepID=UPI0015F7EB66|nr:ATP-grasp domain-containing protein [Streptomyces calidiresistens]